MSNSDLSTKKESSFNDISQQFFLENHDEKINKFRLDLQSGKDVYDQLRHCRIEKMKYFAPSSDEIATWISDLNWIKDDNKRFIQKLNVYRDALMNYPIVKYWEPYLELILENKSLYIELGLESSGKLDELVAQALECTQYDFGNSHRIWKLVLQFAKFKSLSEQIEIHLKRLAFPHSTLEESFQEFSSFVTSHMGNDYEKYMIEANKIYSKTLKKQRYYEKHELLLKKQNSPELWASYLSDVGQYGHAAETHTLFERAIGSCSHNDIYNNKESNWPALWISYIYMIYESRDKLGKNLESVLIKFIKTFPQSSAPYAEYVRNCAIFENGIDKFQSIRKRYTVVDVMNTNDYEDWKVLALAVIHFFHTVNTNESVKKLETHIMIHDLTKFVEFAIEKNADKFHVVEKTAIPFLETLDPEISNLLLVEFCEKNQNQTDTWLFLDKLERGISPTYTGKNLECGLQFVVNLDKPEIFLSEWLSKKIWCSSEEYCISIAHANKVMSLVSLERVNSNNDIQETVITKKSEATKMSTIANHRKRENYTVKITNLPQNINESKLIEFFKDCGTPIEIKLYEINSVIEATVEFMNDDEFLKALSRDKKYIEDHQVNVFKSEQTTIWVTNYPPSMKQDEVENFFSQAGKIISVRFPSLKYNQNRRFCYIEYAGSEMANFAVEKFNGYTLDKYKLVVKISKPEEKGSRHISATEDKREIFIQNLNFRDVSVESLENEFQEFGTIEKIVLPKGSEGNSNAGYGFISFKFKSSAENALGKNGQLLAGRPMNISISQPKNLVEKKNKQSVNKENTIRLINVDDSIRREEIKKFTEVVGPVVNVDIGNEFVSVEFLNSSDAGKAALELNGQKLGSNIIKVEAESSNSNREPIIKKKLLIPPHLMKRSNKVSTNKKRQGEQLDSGIDKKRG